MKNAKIKEDLPAIGQISLQIGRIEGQVNKEARLYRCRFVTAGRVKACNGELSNIEVTEYALMDAVIQGLFDSKASFLDHAGWFENPSLRDLVGVTLKSAYDSDTRSVEGDIKIYDTPAGDLVNEIIEQMLSDRAAGGTIPDVGLSIVFWPVWDQDEDSEIMSIIKIKQVESVDFVFQPAADGRVLEKLSAYFHSNGGKKMVDELQDIVKPSAQPAQEALKDAGHVGQVPVEDKSCTTQDKWANAMAEATAKVLISASGLPMASRERLAAHEYKTPQEVDAAIDAERAYLAKLTEDKVISLGGLAPRGGNIQMGRTSLERIELALEALLTGKRPVNGIQPLTGIRELYNLLSGDYEMTGVFQPERIQFANVTCSTMSNMTANVLNKVIAAEFMLYPQWWLPIVASLDFATLQAVRWITLGGVGELPTVAEGAAYTELTWDDKYETSSFVKKGGYLGLTIEAIDKDDTNRLQAAPRALAQAAWLTLGKAISYIFTQAAGLGPTLIDTGTLFNSTAVTSSGGHANLGATALSITTWNAARLAMRKQAELNSGERLGALTTPRYLLVPPDLEITALQVLGTGADYLYALSNGVVAPVNVGAEGSLRQEMLNSARERVIVVDLFTDTNNWYAVADPQLYPSIGIGYRYGRVPEIYSVASPTAGLMFSNDTMPIKVRFFFAVGPIDWRGMYGAVVTGG
jgi:hypothetical protein